MNSSNTENATGSLKKYILDRFGNSSEIFLFGSVARGDYDEQSDIDILILLPGKVNTSLKEEIYEEAYEIGLKHDVVFGIVIYELDFWNSELAEVMPLYTEIEKENIKI